MVILVSVACTPTKPTPKPPVAAENGVLNVTVSGLRNDKGQVMVSLFAGSEGFPDDVARSHVTVTVPVINGQAKVDIQDVPYGVYAISVLHDENNDGEMETSFLGTPREGFSFSGNPQYKFGHPEFDDARFYLFAPQKKQALTMRYETGRQEHRVEGKMKREKHPDIKESDY